MLFWCEAGLNANHRETIVEGLVGPLEWGTGRTAEKETPGPSGCTLGPGAWVPSEVLPRRRGGSAVQECPPRRRGTATSVHFGGGLGRAGAVLGVGATRTFGLDRTHVTTGGARRTAASSG